MPADFQALASLGVLTFLGTLAIVAPLTLVWWLFFEPENGDR